VLESLRLSKELAQHDPDLHHTANFLNFLVAERMLKDVKSANCLWSGLTNRLHIWFPWQHYSKSSCSYAKV